MSRRSYLVLLCGIGLLAWTARLVPHPRTIDDAYITFRYARNLLAGAGLVFNPGERVLGTTTPFYTFLLAVLAGLSGRTDYPRLAVGLNALADVLTCVVLARLARQLSGRRSAGCVVAGLWAIAPMSVTFAIGGMETSVFILLMTLSAALYLAGRLRWAMVPGALLVLTRPDGMLFVGLLGLDGLLRGLRARRWPWAEAGLLAGLWLPWVIFATVYFGSPLPHSVVAKALAYRLQPLDGLVRLIQHYSTPFMEHHVLGSYWQLAGLFVYLALCLVGLLAAWRRNTRAWVLGVYPWVYLLVFAVANPLIFRWYLAPPLPFYFVFIVGGLAQLAGRWPVGRWLFAGVSIFFCVCSLTDWRLHPDHGPAAPAPDMAWFKLELLYTRVAREILVTRYAVTPETVVAAGDVGALGYYGGTRILDTVGLMSPEASAYYPLPPEYYTILYAVPPKLILDRQPDFVVLLEVYGRTGLFQNADFLAQYTLVEKIDTDIYGSDGLLVWRRR